MLLKLKPNLPKKKMLLDGRDKKLFPQNSLHMAPLALVKLEFMPLRENGPNGSRKLLEVV
jgi:hypothetical protein